MTKSILSIIFSFIQFELIACSCSYETIELTFKEYFDYDKIFIGTVDSSSSDSSRNHIKYFITIENQFKGNDAKNIIIGSTIISGSCPSDLSIGETYLIFSQKNATSSCSRTRALYPDYEKIFNGSELDSLLIPIGGERVPMSISQTRKLFKRKDSLELDLLKKVKHTRDGKIVATYLNGNPSGEINLKDGILEGELIYYDGKGRITLKGQYKNAMKSGIWEEHNRFEEDDSKYHLLSKGAYSEGLKEGVWKTKIIMGDLNQLRSLSQDTTLTKEMKTEYLHGEPLLK